MLKSKGRSRFIFLCVAPAVILFTVFMIIPTLNVFRMSLFERGAYSPTETFVGLNNFEVLFQDAKFIRSMQNTILLIVVVTIITFFFALTFAVLLCRGYGAGAVEGRKTGHGQHYNSYGLAGHRLLHGHVHGLHVCRVSQPL